MKNSLKIILAAVILCLIGVWIYWQYNKKHIIRNAVENAVSNKTDSLYYIHYDSSAIDEVNGNASFYNVTLQSDSLQQQLLKFDTASETSIYNIHIGEVSVTGANIPLLLASKKVEANVIRLVRPVIYIISSGTKKKKTYSRSDTLAIYEKILGKFKSIKASQVIIENGILNFTHKIETPYVSLSGINVNLKNILIDSTKDYDNIISYFIKDITVSVKNTYIKNEETNAVTNFANVEYNALQKLLKLGSFQQKDGESGKIIFDIGNSSINGLNTDSFILKKQLKAEELVSDGGLLSFYRKKLKDSTIKNDEIEIDNNFFDEAQLNKIAINNTKIIIYNKDEPNETPFTLTNVKFSASEIQHLYSGTNIKDLIGRSNWNLSADGFSFITRDKVYKLSVGPFNISKASGKMHIDYFSLKPQLTEAEYVKTLKAQTDLYNISINNIDLTGIKAEKLLTDKKLIAETAIIHPVIKVSCDRTLPSSKINKIGNYPHQLIQKMKFPIYVKKMFAKDGYISYTERGEQSKQQGTVFFSNANGVIENITNIPEYIKKNNMLTLTATTKLMGISNLKTSWRLPLNTFDGAFNISGSAGSFNATALNPLIKPLALVSINKGTIKGLNFSMSGNDNGAKGTSTLLYNDLKIEALKKDSTEVKKRGLLSFMANLLVKDDNPKNGNTRVGEINIERDKTRSFFNLVWKGIFKAAKRTALGKDDEK